ncbi:hypothetical protein N9936_01285 [bacterium]|nr:hypothetical protein [bacterium]
MLTDKLIGTGLNFLDDSTESAEERQKTLSDRHANDMQSDNWLSKSIRPLALLILLGLQIVIVALSAFGFHVDMAIVVQHGTLLMTAFGFYFSSRKAEKIAAQKAKSEINIKELEAKTAFKQSRRDRRRNKNSNGGAG